MDTINKETVIAGSIGGFTSIALLMGVQTLLKHYKCNKKGNQD